MTASEGMYASHHITSKAWIGRTEDSVSVRKTTNRQMSISANRSSSTPSLKEQLADVPEDLPNLVILVVVGELRIGSKAEADRVTGELVSLVGERSPLGYDWPGNLTEHEQCVHNFLIHRK
jgi:hypothetical protein